MLNAAHVGIVQFHLHAVLAAQERLALEVIAQLSLIGPFAQSHLRVVGIEGSQGVGVVEGESLEVVDACGNALLRPLTAERHVLRALGLQEQAEALLGVGSGEHGHVARLVGIVVVIRRVAALAGILAQQTPVAVVNLGTHVPGIDIAGEEQLVGGIDEDLILCGLVLVHPRGP